MTASVRTRSLRTPFVVLASFTVAVVLAAGCTGPPNTQWTQFRRTADGAAVVPNEPSITMSSINQFHEVFRAPLGNVTSLYPTPVVGNGRVYVGASGELEVFDAAGSTGCNLGVCTPLWTANTFGATDSYPALAGRYVLVNSYTGTTATKIEAFDAAGSEGCSGQPVVCTPLWSTTVIRSLFHPVIENGFVFADDGQDRLAAYDAAGQNGCSGVPKVCAPVWTSSPLTGVPNVSVANGIVVAVPLMGDHPIMAFDAAGQQGCSGTPTRCEPLWQSDPVGARQRNSYPAIAGGRVYAPLSAVGTSTPTAPGILEVFDLAGTTGCAGTPKVCQPLWTGNVPIVNPYFGGPPGMTAVGNGFVYAETQGSLPRMAVFDAAGTQNCSGTPVVCQPLWFMPYTGGSVAVVNDLVVAGLYAYDAHGEVQDSGPCYTGAYGSLPSATVCGTYWAPLAHGTSGAAVVNGRLYTVDLDSQSAIPPAPATLRVYARS